MNTPTVLTFPEFLSPSLRNEILAFEADAFGENANNYAVRSQLLPPPISAKLEEALKRCGIEGIPAEFWLRVETAEGVHDENSFIHIDPKERTAIVVYLSNTLYLDSGEAGTTFWQHLALGKKSIDRLNARDVFLYNTVLRMDGLEMKKWNSWLQCPFQENQAIVFDTNAFHSAPHPKLPKNKAGKRITLSLFLS